MNTIQAFNFSVDLLRAMLWQYNEASNLQGLLDRKKAWYDINQTAFWEDWITDVFDLRTANTFGLAVWGIILNTPLYFPVPATLSRKVFGFDSEAGGFDSGFDEGFDIGAGTQYNTNFFDGNFGSTEPSIQRLPNAESRTLLRLRYFNLTMRPSAPQVNAILADIFSDLGPVYVIDNLDMTITYVFQFQPSSALLYMLNNFDILPRPAGVKLIRSVVTRDVFGFSPESQNFFNGNFGA